LDQIADHTGVLTAIELSASGIQKTEQDNKSNKLTWGFFIGSPRMAYTFIVRVNSKFLKCSLRQNSEHQLIDEH